MSFFLPSSSGAAKVVSVLITVVVVTVLHSAVLLNILQKTRLKILFGLLILILSNARIF